MLTQQAYDLMPRVKITDLLFEVDQWTNFTPHFTHLKSDAEPPDRTLPLTGDYMCGMPTNALPRGDSGPCATENRRGRLGVRKNPFLEGTPKCVCTSANRGDGIRVQGTGHLLQRPTLVVERAKLA